MAAGRVESVMMAEMSPSGKREWHAGINGEDVSDVIPGQTVRMEGFRVRIQVPDPI